MPRLATLPHATGNPSSTLDVAWGREDDLANEERVKRARERLFQSTDVLFSKYQVDLADADDLGEMWRPQLESVRAS